VTLVIWLLATAPGETGHEFPFYPSFYPQEITLEVLDPAQAPARFADGSLHAYAGGDAFSRGPAPANVGTVESLGAYVVITLNPQAPFFSDRGDRCRAARAARESLVPGGWLRHPYPVTPYHGDFLAHADLARAAQAPASPNDRWRGAPLRIRAGSAEAARLLPPGAAGTGAAWDVSVDMVLVSDLWAPWARPTHAGGGAPWIEAGWFHAVLLQAGAMADPDARRHADAMRRRLVDGAHAGTVERLDLERRLVALLGTGCERTVAGFTLRREHVNLEYSGGVENVAHDALSGLRSAVFPRTVKLKDFPWNGWLTVGLPGAPTAAWNPVAGFTDPTGRLLWQTVADPAFFPSPTGGSWVPNRVSPAAAVAGPVTVDPGALVPEAGTGLLRKAGAGRTAAARIEYRVLASHFHDGTRLTVPDLLYAVSLAYRTADPGVGAATAALRDNLVALRPLRVETDVLAFGEDKLTYEVPVVEVYLRAPAGLPGLEVLAPPWTSVPWHLLVLMEEAVGRGLAAFSREEAERGGRPWLDLVRDARLVDSLARLVDDLARRGHVPPPLAGLVTADEARARYTALRAFYDAHRHFLVTNGPYRLHRWTPTTTVLQVFRDLTYPRGVGSFNRFAIPLQARVTQAEVDGARLRIRAEVERVERFGREYRIVREPFVRRVSEQDRRSLPVCHYVVVGPDGAVVAAGTVLADAASTFSVDLPRRGAPGRHTVLVALVLDDNRVNLPLEVVPWTP
jgi:hypothetical protein